MHPCRLFLHRHDFSFALLSESTMYFGNNPRRCFEASVSVEKLRRKEKKIEGDIKRVASEGTDYII